MWPRRMESAAAGSAIPSTDQPGRRGRSQRAGVALTGVATVVLGALVGITAGLTGAQWLALGLGVSLVLWVGGAVSGQILLARLIDAGNGRATLDYLTQLLWIIPRVYVPLGFVALGCGIGLVEMADATYLSATVMVPTSLYAATAIVGSSVSAPGYSRLVRRAREHGLEDADLIRRLLPLAWVNRVELALVIGAGLVLLASAT